MKKRISLSSSQSSNYLFNRLVKQFKSILEENSIGEMLTSKQILTVLILMGFADEQPNTQDIELSKTLNKMLASPRTPHSVYRGNLFKFFTIICDVQETQNIWENSWCETDIFGLALDVQEKQQPMIVIKMGEFDQNGHWFCSEGQKMQIQEIFKFMKIKRISRGQGAEVNRKSLNNQPPINFKPKICLKSSEIAHKRNKKLSLNENGRVEDRLLQTKQLYQNNRTNEMKQSKEKQLVECTFKPRINRSSSCNKENIKQNSSDHLKKLINKGNLYKSKREKLKQIQIKLNESAQLQGCTFKPSIIKQPQSTKWVYVRNREKQIDRLREGRKHRQFVNQVKERGYPQNVSWNNYLNNSKQGKQCKQPILCLDLKIMNEKNNIKVYEGDNLTQIVEKISRQNGLPEKSWGRVEQLIFKSIQQCPDVEIQSGKIYSTTSKV